MTRQLSKSMAHLLAASGCDLGDERDVLRTLKAAGNAEGDIMAFSDIATEMARGIRANSKKLAVS